MSAQAAVRRARPRGARRRAALAGVVVLILCLGIVPLWAEHEGYIPPWDPHAGCTSKDHGARTYEELIDLGLSPFCARAYNDKAWW